MKFLKNCGSLKQKVNVYYISVPQNDVKSLRIQKYRLYIPARRYMTPVTRTALIWCLSTPKAPTSAEHPRMIRQTSAHEMLRFCIPDIHTTQQVLH